LFQQTTFVGNWFWLLQARWPSAKKATIELLKEKQHSNTVIVL